MKILLISYYFAPNNAIASVRTTKIAKYLKRLGHEVEIVCGPTFIVDPILKKDLESLSNVHVIHGSKLYERKQHEATYTKEDSEVRTIIQQNNRWLKNLLCRFLRNNLTDYLSLFNSIIWFRNAKLAVSDANMKTCDVVISSFGPIGSLFLAEYFKKISKNSLWIIDYRDPIVLDTQKGLLKLFYIYYQNRILKKCDMLFCVSSGLMDYLGEKAHRLPIYKIPNGYDTEDIQQDIPIFNYSITLSFSYCGSLYGGRRDFSVFFKLLRELIDEKEIEEEKIVVVYAGPDFSIFETTANKYSLGGILKNYRMVSRDVSLGITRSTDISLLASWNMKESRGVMTGKIYELFLLRKPVYAFISGDYGNSEIRSVMEETRAGMVYEEFGNYNYENIKQNIKKLYKQKMNNEKVAQIYDNEKVRSFSYQEIVKKIDNILSECE